MAPAHTESLQTLRWQRTHDELARLRRAINAWIDQRQTPTANDPSFPFPPGRHHARLETLRGVFHTFLDNLEHRADAAKPPDEPGELQDQIRSSGMVYQHCAAIDKAAAWVYRLWQYYQARFDQRGHESLGPLLLAADEVVWSLYAPPLRGQNVKKPAPLCFIDPVALPWALESHRSLAGEVAPDDVAASLDIFVRTVPVPLLGLPPWYVASPWWLVYLAHEIGHHVQRDAGLGQSWPAWLKQVTGQERWSGWQEEVFADIYSVLALGGWASLALAEALWTTPELMLIPDTRYPPPVVRIELTARLAKALQQPLPEAIAPFRWEILEPSIVADPTLAAKIPSIEEDLRIVDHLIAELISPQSPFRNLTHGLFALPVPAGGWANELFRSADVMGQPKLEAAREAVCGALSAWLQWIQGQAPAGITQEELAVRTTKLLRLCAEPGVRAGEQRTADEEKQLQSAIEQQVERLFQAMPAASRSETVHAPEKS